MEMLLGMVVISVASVVALWVNDHTQFGGPEFADDRK